MAEGAGASVGEAEAQRMHALVSNDYKQLAKVVLALRDERKEHVMVLESIAGLNDDRRCFRSVGGVLVEHSLSDARKALEGRVKDELEPKIAEMEGRLIAKEQELTRLEQQLGRRPSDRQPAEAEAATPSPGVLA